MIDAREKHAVLNAPKKFQKKLKAQIKNGITAATLMRSRYLIYTKQGVDIAHKRGAAAAPSERVA